MNLTPLLETFHIRDKRSHIIGFEPNWAQKQIIAKVESDYEQGLPTRVIILKARQLGISTCVQAILFGMCVIFDNVNAVVVAHRADSSEHLFGMSKLIYETWALKDSFPARYSTRRELTLEHKRSQIRVMTADKADIGRGRTLSFLHSSELSMWRSPVETMLGFAPSIPPEPGTAIFIESTAKGVGNYFEELWKEAEAGENDYTPMFFPWFKHHEYLPCLGGCETGTCAVCEKAVKGFAIKGEEEKRLDRLGATKPHLAWRRWALTALANGDEDYFRQEFPATPDEAFLATGVNAFNPTLLDDCFERRKPRIGRLVKTQTAGKIEFIDDPKGPLRVYSWPSADKDWGSYFIGADCSNGTMDGDFAAAQVINRHDREQVAVWHGRINPDSYAEELAKLGTYYNRAMIAPDIMGGGGITLGSLMHLYDNIWAHRQMDRWPGQDRSKALGFLGTWQRKQAMIGRLASMVERGQVKIHDTQTYREMRAYVFYGAKGWNEQYGPASRDGHDDLVCALAIAILCDSLDDPVNQYIPRSDLNREPEYAGLTLGDAIKTPSSDWDEEAL